MNDRWNIPANKDLSLDEIIRQGGYYDIDNLWNNITLLDNKLYRGRVETLVISESRYVYAQLTRDGGYRIPGGSFEKDISHINQAQAEVLEEAKIVCTNTSYTGINYIKEFTKKFERKENRIYWEGTYNEVYVAEYVKPYIGVIHPKNRDEEMYKEGQWHLISDIWDRLSKYHKKALSVYMPEKDPVNGSSYSESTTVIDSPYTDDNRAVKLELYPYYTPEEMHELGVMNEGHNFYCEDVEDSEFTKKWFDNYNKNSDAPMTSDWYYQLSSLYHTYKANPSDQIKQRILNLGWNPEVPVTVDNVKRASALAKEKREPKEVVELNENFVFSKNHTEYNLDKWESGKSNILIITGLSGSGKTTTAYTLAEYYKNEFKEDIKIIQLDHIQNYNRFINANHDTETTKIIKKFLNKNKELKDVDFSDIRLESFKPVFNKFFPWLLKELEKDKKTKYIVEGIHILLFTKYSDIKKYPLICINTSMTKSIVRHWIRDKFTLGELIRYGITDIKLFKDWEDQYKDFYGSMSESSYIEEGSRSKKPFYFYHLFPKNVNNFNKIASTQYMYDNNMDTEEVLYKYRKRVVSDWGVYPNKKEEDLTDEEILNALNQFRGEGGSKTIYFFKYPPYKELGPNMKNILKDKDIYRIDINDKETRKYIEKINWGYDQSHTGNKPLTEEYYKNITQKEYFSKYDDNGTPLFASLNHIGIVTKNGYIPKKCLKLVSNTYMEESVEYDTSTVSDKEEYTRNMFDEDAPSSFLNKRSKPVKNIKSHYHYLKKKAYNKTNNATDQKELPKFNQIGEAVEMKSIKEVVDNVDIYPIFIVNSFTNTTFGKAITIYTRSKYSHSAIAFDSSLKTLYSFNADNKVNKLGGLSIESIDGYIKTYNDASIQVNCIFVKKADYDVIKNALDDMLKNQKQTTYGYTNIFNILLGKAKNNVDNTLSMICSQFVYYIIHKSDIKLVDKPDNLVTPKDLATITNPRVYNVYEGYARAYDKKKTDRLFRILKTNALLIKESLIKLCI